YLDSMSEARAKNIVKQRERDRTACAEDAFFGDAEDHVEAFRAIFEFRGEQLFAVEQIKNGVGEAERAAELRAATEQGSALLADFFETNLDVRRAVGVVELNVNVLFADGLEIACAREFRQADFERVFVERMALAQRNSAAHIAITEFVQALEVESAHNVRRRVAEIEFEPHGMCFGVEDGVSFYRWQGTI